VVSNGILDEPCGERGIQKRDLVDHGIKHLMKYKIHHIQREVHIGVLGLGTLISIVKKTRKMRTSKS
jgi:hypothetical protein